MKQAELIEMLQYFPSDAEVFIEGNEDKEIEVATVFYVENLNKIIICRMEDAE